LRQESLLFLFQRISVRISFCNKSLIIWCLIEHKSPPYHEIWPAHWNDVRFNF
jgi:hypothetical protein